VLGGVLGVAVWSAASIGLFVLVLPLTMLVRGVRGRPRHGFWPPIVGVGTFFAAFNLIGHIVGFPPFWPVILASIAIGFGGAYLARLALLRWARRRNQLTNSSAL
jgi:hypothetical protein